MLEAEAALKARAAILKAANLPLVRWEAGVDSLVAAAKNIRTELKAAFPGVKFSVTSSRYSGGTSINVKWVDGPMVAQVDDIVDKYKAGHFRGEDDLYVYSIGDWASAFGYAKYVMTSREYSAAAVAGALRRVAARYAANLAEAGVTVPTVDEWVLGRSMSWAKVIGNDDVRDLIWSSLSRHTAFAKPVKALAKWPVAIKEGAQA